MKEISTLAAKRNRTLAGSVPIDKRTSRLLAAAALFVFFACWELVAYFEWIRPIFISSPSRIAAAAVWLAQNGLWYDLQVSATEFFHGLALAIGLGVSGGVLLGWYRPLHAVFDPFISALYATPRIALLPILILWLGIGIQSKIAVVFLGALFPILINVIAGMRTIDERLLQCAYVFGASDRQIFRTLALPNAVPFIVAGLRLAVGRGLVGIVVGELVASTAGIGHMMSVAGATFQTDKVFVGIFILSGSGYLLSEGLKKLEARFDAWRPEK